MSLSWPATRNILAMNVILTIYVVNLSDWQKYVMC